jgi:O-antigen ligase
MGLTFVTVSIWSSAVLAVLALAAGTRVPSPKMADYLAVAFFIVCYSSLLWTQSASSWPLHVYWYAACLSAYLLTRLFGHTRSALRLLGYGILTGIAVGGALVSETTNEWNVAQDRQSIEALNANFTAYALAGSLYACVVLDKYRIFPTVVRMALPLVAAFALYKVVLLGSRGALVSAVAICLWPMFSKVIPSRLVPMCVAIAVSVAVLFVLGLFDYVLVVIDLLSARSTGDLSGRLPTWEEARAVILAHPLLGIGIGAFPVVSNAGIGAHNIALTLLLEVGFIGFATFAAFLLAAVAPTFGRGSTATSRYVLGLFFVYWLPNAVSGHWEAVPFAWILLALTVNLLDLPPDMASVKRQPMADGHLPGQNP